MKKEIIIIMSILIICCLSYVLVNSKKLSDNTTVISEISENSEMIHGKVAFYAESLEEVVDKSTVIIDATVGTKIKEIEVGPGFTFVITEVKVNEVIKGNGVNKDDTLYIIQTKNLIEDPILENESNKILFLNKYENNEYSNNTNTYACVGGYQGIYNINDDGTISNSLKIENLDSNPMETDTDNVNEDDTGIYTEDIYKDFASGKLKDDFLKEIKELK